MRPVPKRSPTTSMPAINGPSMTCSGRSAASRASSVSSTIQSLMPSTSACVSRSFTGASRQERSRSVPVAVDLAWSAISSSRSVASGPAVEHEVLDALAQLRVEVVDDRQGAGVDDGHVQPGGDGVDQEDGVDSLAHRVVATERERDVGDAAAGEHARQLGLDAAHGLDEGHGVARRARRCRCRWRRCWGRG